jgi:hypothetical protein
MRKLAAGAIVLLVIAASTAHSTRGAKTTGLGDMGEPPRVSLRPSSIGLTSPEEAACLSVSRTIRRDLNHAGYSEAVTTVVRALEMHPTESRLQRSCFRALADLSSSNLDTMSAVVKEGGVTAIVEVMERNRISALAPDWPVEVQGDGWAPVWSVEVQGEGCRALGNLALNSANRASIRSAGGIRAVVEAMRGLKEEAWVQGFGCSALKNLAANNKENRDAIRECGGIRSVVEAMRRHQQDASVQERGCGALMILALNEENKLAIVNEGGIQMVAKAKDRHPEIAAVQEACGACGALLNIQWTCGALQNLGWLQPWLQQQIKEPGGRDAGRAAIIIADTATISTLGQGQPFLGRLDHVLRHRLMRSI